MAEKVWLDRDKDFVNEYSDLQKRMESDVNIYRMVGDDLVYLSGAFQGKKIPDTITEVTALIRIFADNLIADICEGKMQLSIETNEKLSDTQKAAIVKWLEIMLQAADEYNLLRGDPPLFSSIVSQLAQRGRTIDLVYPHLTKDKKFIIPHIVAWDTAYSDFLSAIGDQGWGIYKMTRSKSQLQSEYPDLTIPESKTIKVWDCWDSQLHDLLLEEKEANTEPHGLGFCPAIQEIVQNTPFLRDENYKKYEGEAIYAPVRETIKRFNRFLSIESSLAYKSFQNGLQLKTDDPNAKPDDPYGNRKVNIVGIDGGYYPMPIEDLKMSTQIGHQSAEKELRMGTIPILELGEIKGENTLPQITQANDVTRKRESPLIKAAERTIERICRMAIAIARKQEWTNVREFIPDIELELPQAKLDAKFKVKCQITPVAPLENIARYQLGMIARQLGRPQRTIFADILKVENPEEEMLQANEEMVESKSEKLAIWKAARRNLESDDEKQREEGALLALELGLTKEQVLAGEMIPKTAPTETQSPQEGVSQGLSVGGTNIAGQQEGMAKRKANLATKLGGQ